MIRATAPIRSVVVPKEETFDWSPRPNAPSLLEGWPVSIPLVGGDDWALEQVEQRPFDTPRSVA